jgi:hypothetical protein
VLILWLGNLLGTELVYRHGRRVEQGVAAAAPAEGPPDAG